MYTRAHRCGHCTFEAESRESLMKDTGGRESDTHTQLIGDVARAPNRRQAREGTNSKAQEEIGKMRARLTYSRLESLSPKYATFRKQVDVHVRYLRANR